eukprot:366503-Chlamydomonas_euryale.AAC.11
MMHTHGPINPHTPRMCHAWPAKGGHPARLPSAAKRRAATAPAPTEPNAALSMAVAASDLCRCPETARSMLGIGAVVVRHVSCSAPLRVSADMKASVKRDRPSRCSWLVTAARPRVSSVGVGINREKDVATPRFPTM